MKGPIVVVAAVAVSVALIAGAGWTQEAGKAGLKIGVMPKLIGIDFFNATEIGAKEAGKELGVTVDFDGPVTSDVTLQAQMLETWIAKKYDAIAIAPNDPDAIDLFCGRNAHPKTGQAADRQKQSLALPGREPFGVVDPAQAL